MRRNNQQRKTKSNKAAFVFGIIFFSVSFFFTAFAAAFILSGLKNPLGASKLTSFAVLLISGAISGFCTAKYKGGKSVLTAGLCAVFFALVLLGAGLITSGGKVATISVVNLIAYVLLASVFAALASKEKKRKVRR